MKLKKLTLILAALMFVVNILTAQEKKLPKVAVSTFDITAGAVTSEEADAITELFISELVSTGKVDVVDRANFDKIIKEMKFQASDWSNKEKTAALGNAVNATMVVRGQIIKLGSKMYLSSTIIDVKTAVVLSSAKELFSSLDDIFGLLTKFAAKTIEGLSPIKIGDIGPGGGIVFYIEGKKAYEISEVLKYGNDLSICKKYCGGGYSNWYLPSLDQLKLVYKNLVLTKKIHTSGETWSATGQWLGGNYGSDRAYINFGTGSVFHESDWQNSHDIRAVREFNIDELSSNKKEYKIGDTGPSGGIVFHIKETLAFEVSANLGVHTWYNAFNIVKQCNAGRYKDWRLPTKTELNLIYQNLIKTGILNDTTWHWSSSQDDGRAWGQGFRNGNQSNNQSNESTYSVRAVRAFNIE